MTTTVFFFEGMLPTHMGSDHGIKIPETEEYEAVDYPHWTVFCAMHVGQTIDLEYVEHNAKLIGSIPDDEIKTITPKQLEERGLHISRSKNLI